MPRESVLPLGQKNIVRLSRVIVAFDIEALFKFEASAPGSRRGQQMDRAEVGFVVALDPTVG